MDDLMRAAVMVAGSNPMASGGDHVAIPREAYDILVAAARKAHPLPEIPEDALRVGFIPKSVMLP